MSFLLKDRRVTEQLVMYQLKKEGDVAGPGGVEDGPLPDLDLQLEREDREEIERL